ncbi:MAG TPA: hypothetical protein VMF31_13840 [Solirubrobacterales bacterium]|nr:hypothetical protein [Solirubrobacterales bacterium]
MFDAVPNDSTGYVFAAYVVFLLMILIYIGILGAKFQRINRDIGELTDEVEAGKAGVKPASRNGGTEAAEPEESRV